MRNKSGKHLFGLAICGLLACAGVAAAQADREALSEKAFEGAQWVMATQAARAVAQVGARAATGDGALAVKIRARQKLEADLTLQRRLLADAVAEASGDANAIRDRASGMAKELEQLDAAIRADFPKYAELSSPRPLNFADLRAVLSADEALVLFLSDRTATFVWAITPTGQAWHRADLSSQDLSDMIRTLRADLDPTGPSRAAVSLSQSTAGPRVAAFDGAMAHALYNALLAPVMPVLSTASHVYVVKDGPLSSLPLSVLLTQPPEMQRMDADDLRDAAWLLRDFALTTLPAVSSLASIRAARQARVGVAGFAGFGAPDFAGTDAETPPVLLAEAATRSIDAFFGVGGAQLDAIRALPPLPGTARELRQIAGLFPEHDVAVTLGADATEVAVKTTDLSRTAILSFATHGLVTGDISGLAEPALAFAPPENASADNDGLLTASEASALDLNADWVILSACNTAASDGTPGAEGLSGLARAFLFAGARSILVSHWPVRDDVAGSLTTETLRRLNADPTLGRSEALRQAMLSVMQDDSDPTLAHPSAWAPFVVVGDGGALAQ